jgi:hypothetical protein
MVKTFPTRVIYGEDHSRPTNVNTTSAPEQTMYVYKPPVPSSSAFIIGAPSAANVHASVEAAVGMLAAVTVFGAPANAAGSA